MFGCVHMSNPAEIFPCFNFLKSPILMCTPITGLGNFFTSAIISGLNTEKNNSFT